MKIFVVNEDLLRIEKFFSQFPGNDLLPEVC
jgi:hypothetical protein